VTAGADVSAAELLAAEASERLERLRAEAAAERAQQAAEREAAQRLKADRQAMQIEWTRANTDEIDVELDKLLHNVKRSAAAYLTAVQQRADAWATWSRAPTRSGSP
jgi:hypothetical protein